MKTLKIFVAGSKDLFNERNLFKIVANDLQTEFGIGDRRGVHIEVRTFENFEYFFGEHLKGAQDSYNQYISNEADAVFFVFDDKVGGITREEFNVAYDAFKDDGRPRMCVFSKLHPGQPNEDIAELRQMCSAVGQYYTDYADNTDLRNKIERSIRQLCNAKLSGAQPKPSRRRRKVKKAEGQVGEVKPATQQRSFHKMVEPLIRYLIVALGIFLILSLVWMGEGELEENAKAKREVAQLGKHRSDSLALVAQRLEKEKANLAEQERIAKEKAEQERIAQEQKDKAEAERKAAQQAAKTYKVGDYYDDGTKQGVVFDVWDDGRHGKIVSLEQSAKMLEWRTYEQYKKKIVVGADSESNGKANTDKVMTRGDADQYPAFVWCRNKGVDWYLPAIDELELLLTNVSVRDAVNKTLAQKGGIKLRNKVESGWYWSSTEYDKSCAWYVVYRDDGYTYGTFSKGSYHYVRAVSAF